MRRVATARVIVGLALAAILVAGMVVSAQRAAANGMSAAATKFLASLSAEQRKQATFALESEERLRWNFIPTEAFPRNGLLLKDMNGEQRTLAHALLRSALSDRGYMTYTSIIQLENVLRELEKGGKFVRDPEIYRFSIFGQPADKGAWAWRVEGHHVSLHFTVNDGKVVSSTPSFAGTNPAEVREGPEKGKRILGELEDAGRALVMALDATQRQTAIFQERAPNEILTNNTLNISPLAPAGISHAAMTPPQRELLMKLINGYSGLMATEIAADRMAKITAAGFDTITFAWAGPLERGAQHYYRVQGPTFLIEFDNVQNQGNHVHSIWRDFNGDFGRDVLREHLKTAHAGRVVPGL